MAKTVAPLLSFAGSGQVAKTQVYATWRGVPYVRRYVVPGNPNTTGQQSTRGTFAFFSNVWKNAPALLQDPWTLFATGQPFYNRNAFIGQNTKAVRGETDLTAMIGSPGAKGGLAPLSIAATAASGELTIEFTNPTPPTGWTITAAVAAVILNEDPLTPTSFLSKAGSDSETFDSVAITGLSTAEYQVMGWLKWMKPDGSTAYGPSISTTGTPT